MHENPNGYHAEQSGNAFNSKVKWVTSGNVLNHHECEDPTIA